jgi:hypothetical protein
MEGPNVRNLESVFKNRGSEEYNGGSKRQTLRVQMDKMEVDRGPPAQTGWFRRRVSGFSNKWREFSRIRDCKANHFDFDRFDTGVREVVLVMGGFQNDGVSRRKWIELENTTTAGTKDHGLSPRDS